VRGTRRWILLTQFGAGIALAVGLAYLWLGTAWPLTAATAITVVVHAVSWRASGEVRGLWATMLGFCAALSKVDASLADAALGVLRLPIALGGSILAVAYAALFEEHARFADLVR
jgi:hypothetical protein